MDREPSATGAGLQRVAYALGRVGGLARLVSLDSARRLLLLHRPSLGACAPRATWRRTVTSSIDEPHPSSVRLLLALRSAWLGEALDAASAARRARPWLGLVGIALAWTAVLLAGVRWLLAPLVLCAWYWCPSDWRWTWLIPLGAGVIGAVWVVIGAQLIAYMPLPVAGLIWVALAAALASFGAWLRAVVAYRWPEW